MDNQVQREKLKNQALIERLSAITAQYENQDAERRVDITLLSDEIKRLTQELEEVRDALGEAPVREENDEVPEKE